MQELQEYPKNLLLVFVMRCLIVAAIETNGWNMKLTYVECSSRLSHVEETVELSQREVCFEPPMNRRYCSLFKLLIYAYPL